MPIHYRGNGRNARRGSRTDRLARPPLYWWDQRDASPDHRLWGDKEAQTARVKGRGTLIMTPEKARKEAAGKDEHPAERGKNRVEIAPAGALNWLAKKIPLFNRRHGG